MAFYTTTIYKDEAEALLAKLRAKTPTPAGRVSKFVPLMKHIDALKGEQVLRIEPCSATDVTNLRSWLERHAEKPGRYFRISARKTDKPKVFRAYVSLSATKPPRRKRKKAGAA